GEEHGYAGLLGKPRHQRHGIGLYAEERGEGTVRVARVLIGQDADEPPLLQPLIQRADAARIGGYQSRARALPRPAHDVLEGLFARWTVHGGHGIARAEIETGHFPGAEV